MAPGVVIVTHYRLGEEFLQALRLIVPDAPPFQAVSIDPKQSVDQMREAITDALRRVETGEGVLILTDMFGGTPSNLGITFLEQNKIEIVTGVNLPMLIKAASIKEPASLIEIARTLREHGRNAIWVASDLLRGEKT